MVDELAVGVVKRYCSQLRQSGMVVSGAGTPDRGAGRSHQTPNSSARAGRFVPSHPACRRIMLVMTEGSEARALARGSWPVRRFTLGEEPSDDISGSTTAAERLAMVWELTLEAWRLSGRELPAYDRSAVPGRVIRPAP